DGELGEGNVRRAGAPGPCAGRTAEDIMNSSTTRSHVIVVGSGGRPYREYSFATLARHYRVSAVLPSEPTWQHRYISDSIVADLADPDAIAAAVSALAAERADTGL